MQTTNLDIKRPTLFEPLLNEVLTPDNEFLTYIDTTNTSVTSISSNDNQKPLDKKYYKGDHLTLG